MSLRTACQLKEYGPPELTFPCLFELNNWQTTPKGNNDLFLNLASPEL